MNYNYINFEYLDEIFANDVEIKKKYILTYLEASDKNWDLLTDLLQKNNAREIKMKLHQMKPTFTTFGCSQAADICFDLEQKLVLPQISWSYISTKIDTLKMLETFIILELKFWLSNN